MAMMRGFDGGVGLKLAAAKVVLFSDDHFVDATLVSDHPSEVTGFGDEAKGRNIGDPSLVTGEFHASLHGPMVRDCTDEELNSPSRPSVRILFPTPGQRLDTVADLSLSRSLLVRLRPENVELKSEHVLVLGLAGFNVADISGDFDEHGSGTSYKTVVHANEANVELYGLTEGTYSLEVAIVDKDIVGRSCWKRQGTHFVVERMRSQNRSVALMAGIRSLRRFGGRSDRRGKAWLRQPRSATDFGYVTAVWGEKYMDNVLALSAGLRAVGSSFPLYCLAVPELTPPGYLNLLERCCCRVIAVEPIRRPGAGRPPPPASSPSSAATPPPVGTPEDEGASSPDAASGAPGGLEEDFAALTLTKLRAFQLWRYGLTRVLLMDADLLMLQNIDELFWLPTPSAVLSTEGYLGETEGAPLSASLVLLEPDENEFRELQRRLQGEPAETLERGRGSSPEQRVLDSFCYFGSKSPLAPSGADGGSAPPQARRRWCNALPIVYAVGPELLEVLPFLSPREAGKDLRSPAPIDHGIKAVHLSQWFNPILAVTDPAGQDFQRAARLKHRHLWQWYELWWKLHQEALALAAPTDFPMWRDECLRINIARYGPDHGSHFVPILASHGCVHTQTGLAW